MKSRLQIEASGCAVDVSRKWVVLCTNVGHRPNLETSTFGPLS